MIINDTLFEHGLNSLFRSRLPTKVAVALSGGPDSMLLTWLLHKHKINHNAFDIYAITIDHKYRRESRREALRVHDYVKNWELKHIIKELDYDEGTDPTSLKNFEEVARTKRYEAFAEVCYQESIPAIFVGHHKDDQLETFIQRLQGNSTIFGLAGTRRISALPVAKDLPPQADNHPQLRVVRPFYNYDKQDIFDTCAVNDLQFVNDPTNLDINLTRRNYLRHMIGDILPEKAKPNSPYEIIDRPSLEQSHASCLEFATLFEEKAHNLSMYLQENNLIETYPSMGSMKIEFPRVCFDPETTVVTSKYLYQELYPYSTLKHYHWAYAKLERQLLPRISQFLQDGKSGTFKMTMMNLVFEVTNNVHWDTVSVYIYRCPITTRDASQIEQSLVVSGNYEWSEWKLFDHRFWYRVRANVSKKLKVVPYDHKKHKSLVDDKLNFEPLKSHNTLPVLVDEETNKICSFPTLGISHALECEWAPKNNRFKYLDVNS